MNLNKNSSVKRTGIIFYTRSSLHPDSTKIKLAFVEIWKNFKKTVSLQQAFQYSVPRVSWFSINPLQATGLGSSLFK